MRPAARTLVSAMCAVLAASAAAAADRPVDKTVPFQLDKWYELDAKEGPVTLHRIRLARAAGGVKVKVLGPSPFEVPLSLELEYSNVASRDWDAALRVEWMDDGGEVIDGYQGKKELDEEKQFEHLEVSLATLRYGLDRARKLRIAIDVKPD